MTDDGPSGAAGAADTVTIEKGLALTHTLRTGTPFMQLLTDFCVRKVFTVLNVWSGEPWLTVDTVSLLASFVDSGRRRSRAVRRRTAGRSRAGSLVVHINFVFTKVFIFVADHVYKF